MDYTIREMWKEEYPQLKDFLYEAVMFRKELLLRTERL